MRIKSKSTTIEYSGRLLLSPGGYFSGDALNDSISTTANSVELVGSTWASIEEHQNAKATRNFSFAYDFENFEAAYIFKLNAEEHAINNPSGFLSIQVGDILTTYKAGLSQLDSETTLTASSIRVVLSYTFLTGKIES